MDRVDGMGTRMDQLQETLLARLGGDEPEAEAEETDWNALLFGEEADPEVEQQRALDPEGLQQMIDARAQAMMDAQLPALQQQIQSIQVGLDAEQLTAKYPDLADPAIAGPVVSAAKELAEALGRPDLAQNMQVVELVYKAQRADKYAAGEQPVGAEQGFELERAGGAGPAGVEPSIAERVIASQKSQNFWEKW